MAYDRVVEPEPDLAYGFEADAEATARANAAAGRQADPWVQAALDREAMTAAPEEPGHLPTFGL
jgi:hypothetical protein